MQVLIFILFTIVIMFANVGLNKFVWMLIQPEQLLGKWQNVLDKLYASESPSIQLLGKLLGNCEMCFYHLWAIIGFVLYNIVARNLGAYLITGWANIAWYFFYVPMVWYLSLKIGKDGL